RVEMGATRDKRDIDARGGESSAEVATDAACPNDGNFHWKGIVALMTGLPSPGQHDGVDGNRRDALARHANQLASGEPRDRALHRPLRESRLLGDVLQR